MNNKLGKFAFWTFITMIISIFIVIVILQFSEVSIIDKIKEGDYALIFNWKNAKYSKEIDIEKEFNTFDIDSIEIESISTDVAIYSRKGEVGKVEFYGKSYSSSEKYFPELVIKKIDNVLVVEIERAQNIGEALSIRNEKMKLDIYIPEKSISEIALRTVSGDIDIEKLIYDKSEIKSVSGKVYIDSAANDITINTVSGDVLIDNFYSNEKLDIESISGDCEIVISNDTKGFSLDYKTVTGNFTNDFKEFKKIEEKRNKVEAIYIRQESYIKVNTTSGNLKLR